MGNDKRNKPPVRSLVMRVEEVNAIYDFHAKKGLGNREIWRRFIFPKFGISERTFYNYLKRCFETEGN